MRRRMSRRSSRTTAPPAAGAAYRVNAAPPATSSRSIGSGSTEVSWRAGAEAGVLFAGPPPAARFGGAVGPVGGLLGAFLAAGVDLLDGRVGSGTGAAFAGVAF